MAIRHWNARSQWPTNPSPSSSRNTPPRRSLFTRRIQGAGRSYRRRPRGVSLRSSRDSWIKALILRTGMRGPGSRRSTAAYCGHAGTVSVLVARGAEVEARDDDGRTPLWLAADVVAASAVRVLLDAGADIDARDSEGRTPLYTAVVLRRGRVEATMAETVRLLVGRGAALNGVDECSATVLGTAALYGGSATLEALLQCGRGVLDVNQIQGEVGHRRTVLALAAALGEEEAVRILMQVEGIDPGIPNMENGMTALMEAVCAMSFYNEGIVRVLARHSGYAGINARDMRGRSALHHAVENQQMDAFEVMLEIDGVDVDCVDADGRTPLDYAVERELEGFVKLIQELSARRQR
ncbi:ankyrin repeat-containing domain protein [Aspergillus heterothallicus]